MVLSIVDEHEEVKKGTYEESKEVDDGLETKTKSERGKHDYNVGHLHVW
jgi:hypothetical protein